MDANKEVFDELRSYARAAADSAVEVPTALIQNALDYADGELGRRMLLPVDQRPDDTGELMLDVRRVRALQRYRLALDGLTATS